MAADSDYPVYRAPMRARDREASQFAGAVHGVANGLIGTGDALEAVPGDLSEAIVAASDSHGDKAGRMLVRFAELPDGVFVWTQTGDGEFRVGRVSGPWRYDDSPPARKVGIHHVRPVNWLPKAFGTDVTPGPVMDAFSRGGRNFQRINDRGAESLTADIWRINAA